MRLLCLDPGVHGSCAYYNNGEVSVHDYPIFTKERKVKKLGIPVVIKRTHYDVPKLVELIKQFPADEVLIEEVSAQPRDGSVQGFSFGKGFGLLIGITTALGMEINYVRPSIWKKTLGLKTGSTKNDSRLLAISLFPELSEQLKLKKNEGRAEALLLLHYFLQKKGIN